MTTQTVPEPAVTATGYSDSYSFTEAFQDALHQLPPPRCPYPDQLLVTRVVDMGSQQGGIAGFDRLYVRIERLPDPAGARAMGGDIPFPIGKDISLPSKTEGGGEPFPLGTSRVRPGEAVPVYAVDMVDVDVAESNPPQYAIRACGRVTTSGWGPAWLRPIPTKKPPKDGVYDFEFVAIPPNPTDPVLQVITPISTPTQLWRPNDGGEVKAVRVIAASNEETAEVDRGSSVTMVKFGEAESDQG